MAELGEYENILVYCSISSTGVSPGLFPTFAGFTHAHTHTFFATMKLTFLLLSGTSQQLLDKLLSCEFVNSGSVELLFLHPVVCFLAASDVQVHYSVE